MASAKRDFAHRAAKAVMKSYHVQIPKYDLPIRFRPWFLIFTCFIMLVLAFLGFTNFSRALPLNDKLLHFLCFTLATAVFYFIFDVEEDARRIWFWRYANLMFTGFVCFFCGGLLSEFVQSMLPYKEFQFGDVVANILGATLGINISYHLEKYYRYRREISRLYRPISTAYSDLEEDDDPLAGTQLLPTHTTTKPAGKPNRLADVWDEREEVFDIGEDDDDERFVRTPLPVPGAAHSIPKITVTNSSS